tara:strand:- start:2813 stop:3193 length:381 start_codon:yes stop_codon:yes gene_type:complete
MIHAHAKAAAVFEAMPNDTRKSAMALRALIAREAEGLDVQECLRWGQPTYIAPKGSMLRIGIAKSGDVALFAHCQTTIISDFAAQFGADFWIEGNRAVVFPTTADIQPEKLRLMVAHALRYKENRI